jgi:predicted nucleic acid-binding protein
MESLKIFLDASVVLAAAGSEKGSSRWIIEVGANSLNWQLLISEWVEAEVQKNFIKLRDPKAAQIWFESRQNNFQKNRDIIDINIDLINIPEKDQPVLLGALCQDADILLTWDREHFGIFFENKKISFGKLKITTPGIFLKSLRNIRKL